MAGNKNQAFGIVLFVAIGVSALALGVLSMAKSIGAPMKADKTATVAAGQASAAAVRAAEEQKAKDTDKDGLSDYDELNSYSTSPYIKDTDSDGIDDGAEVKNGTDPLCPQGKECGGVPAQNKPSAAPSSASSPSAVGESGLDLSGFLSGKLSAPEIREMLKQSGVDSAALDSMTDEQLIKLYEETSGSMTGQKPAQTSAAEDVRKLLKEQGVTDDILNSFSDSELIQMYNETAAGANQPANTN